MPLGRKTFTTQTSFAGGEIDSLMSMRMDLQTYNASALQIENFRQLLHGGLRTRFGTDYCASIGIDGRLASFYFSKTQAYVIAFKNLTLDVYYDDGTLAVGGIVTPWATADLPELKWVQFGDTMFICHEDYVTKKLVRSGAASFALSDFAFDIASGSTATKKTPFFKFAPSTMTLTPSATTGSITLTLSGSGAWTADHVNTYIRYKKKQIQITAYTSATVATGTVIETLPATTADTDWDEEIFSAVHGYARSICLHNNRLVFGGSRDKKSGLWLSQVGQYFNFDLGTSLDAEGIWLGVTGDGVVAIEDVRSLKTLCVFTDAGEFFIPETETKPLAPSTANVRQVSSLGLDNRIQPVPLDGSLFFISRYQNQLHEFLFDAIQNVYSADSVSIRNPSRFDDIRNIAAMPQSDDVPEQYLFACREDGGLVIFHSLRSQQISGISYQSTDGKFRQVCFVNGKIFFLVERTIASATVYYLEKANFDHALDCSKSITVSVGSTAISGLSHLNGKTAAVVSNGYNWGTAAISSGAGNVVSEFAVTSARVGLSFTPTLKPVIAKNADEDGSPVRNNPQRIVRVSLSLHESVRVSVEGQDFSINNVNDDFSQPPNSRTGMYDFFLFGWGFEKTPTISCDVPLPVTIRGLIMEVA